MGQVSVRGTTYQRLRDYVASETHNPSGKKLGTTVSQWLDQALDARGAPVPTHVVKRPKAGPKKRAKQKREAAEKERAAVFDPPVEPGGNRPPALKGREPVVRAEVVEGEGRPIDGFAPISGWVEEF
jgi:hypothetical protein